MVSLVGARHGALARIVGVLRENLSEARKEWVDTNNLYLPLPASDAYYFRGTNPDDVRKNDQVAVFVFTPSQRGEVTVRKRVSSSDGNKELVTFRVHVLLIFKPGLYDAADPFVDGYGNELTHQQLMYYRADTYTDLLDWTIRRYGPNGDEILRISYIDGVPSLDSPPSTDSIIGLSYLTYEIVQDRLVPNRSFT